MFTDNLGYVTDYGLAFHKDDVALLAGDITLTYAELDSRANQVANALLRAGLRPGERMAVIARNDLRYTEALLGAMRAAVVPAPINPDLPSATIAEILDQMRPGMLLLGPDVPVPDLAATGAPLLARWGGQRASAPSAVVDFDAWRDAATSERPTPEAGEEVALQLCTSGSTGVPKRVMMSHRMLLEMVRIVGIASLITPQDRSVVSTPLFHLNASMMGVLMPLMHGGSAVILPGFDAPAVLRTIDRFRCTYLQGVPATYQMLLDALEQSPHVELSSIQFISCGSASMSPELLERLERVFDGVDLMEGYGLTECGTLIMNPRWSRARFGSIGLRVPGYELRIVDANGVDVADGTPGELWVRGESMMLGYAGDPDLTAARYAPGGWFRTHDVVRRESDGYYFFEGRVDDRINVAGEHVYPRQVENLLVQHPGVREVVVVGVAHPVKGQVPVAFVVPNGDLDPDALKQWFFGVGPAYAHPREIHILSEMPLIGTGKVNRSSLIHLAAEHTEHTKVAGDVDTSSATT